MTGIIAIGVGSLIGLGLFFSEKINDVVNYPSKIKDFFFPKRNL